MRAPTLDDLAASLRTVLRASVPPAMQHVLADWPATHAIAAAAPRNLPVTAWLSRAAERATPRSLDLMQMVQSLQTQLDWRQTYSEADVGADFLTGYGWTLVVGPDAPVVSDRLIAGILMFGAGIEYPVHQHSAEETYVVLSGTASWKIGRTDWHAKPPGSVIHNPPWRWHGMRMDQGEPLVLAFLWRGGRVEKSRLAG